MVDPSYRVEKAFFKLASEMKSKDGRYRNIIVDSVRDDLGGKTINLLSNNVDTSGLQQLTENIREALNTDGLQVIELPIKKVTKREFLQRVLKWEDVLKTNLDYGMANRPDNELRADKYLRESLSLARSMGASDLHIQQDPSSIGEKGRLQMRIDGRLRTIDQLSLEELVTLTSVIHKTVGEKQKKTNSNTVIEGSFDFENESGKDSEKESGIKYRVSSMQTNSCLASTRTTGRGMYSTVIRVLQTKDIELNLENLNFLEGHRKLIDRLQQERSGFIVITGETGQGKSTTAGSLVNGLAKRYNFEKKFLTFEDPPEYIIRGATQFQVVTEDEDSSLTLREAVKRCLRQDPDGIFIGETRDAVTAKYMVDLALTGHLILTTMHAEDASNALSRLADWGIHGPTLNVSLLAVIAQKLVRKNCDKCLKERALTNDEENYFFNPNQKNDPEFERFKSRTLKIGGIPIKEGTGIYNGETCPKCEGTGYSGRIPIVEIYGHNKNPNEIIPAICRGEPSGHLEMRKLFQEGRHEPFALNALRHIFNGTVSPTEIKDQLAQSYFEHYGNLLMRVTNHALDKLRINP